VRVSSREGSDRAHPPSNLSPNPTTRPYGPKLNSYPLPNPTMNLSTCLPSRLSSLVSRSPSDGTSSSLSPLTSPFVHSRSRILLHAFIFLFGAATWLWTAVRQSDGAGYQSGEFLIGEEGRLERVRVRVELSTQADLRLYFPFLPSSLLSPAPRLSSSVSTRSSLPRRHCTRRPVVSPPRF